MVTAPAEAACDLHRDDRWTSRDHRGKSAKKHVPPEGQRSCV